MKKIVKAYGKGLIIRISSDDQKMYDILEGDILDIQLKSITRGKEQ